MFLDEIGEMTLRMQGLLLRFLETGELQKVGADRVVGRVNVRVIAATNRNLREMIAQGTFREDLFYRLNVIHLTVPPLRERREDIPALVEHFLASSPGSNGTRRRARHRRPRRCALLVRLPVARQRARARERHRAHGRDRADEHRFSRTTCRRNPAAGKASACARSASAAARSPTISTSGCSRSANRSGRSCIRCTCSARSRARNVRDLVRKGLEEARGNYKIVARMFNMEPRDYKRFLNFLRKHDCQVPFKEYR